MIRPPEVPVGMHLPLDLPALVELLGERLGPASPVSVEPRHQLGRAARRRLKRRLPRDREYQSCSASTFPSYALEARAASARARSTGSGAARG